MCLRISVVSSWRSSVVITIIIVVVVSGSALCALCMCCCYSFSPLYQFVIRFCGSFVVAEGEVDTSAATWLKS